MVNVLKLSVVLNDESYAMFVKQIVRFVTGLMHDKLVLGGDVARRYVHQMFGLEKIQKQGRPLWAKSNRYVPLDRGQ